MSGTPVGARQELLGGAARSFDVSGFTPPPVPSSRALVTAQLRKHLYLAKRRRRYVGAIWACVLYGGLCAAIYFIFKGNWPAVSNVAMSPGGGPSRALSGQGVHTFWGADPPCRDVAAGAPDR